MDFTSLNTSAACEVPREVNIKDANDQPTDFYVTIYGVDSRIYKESMAKIEARTRMADKRNEPLTPEERETDWIELLVRCTVSWRGITSGKDPEGNPIPLPFTQENVRMVYTNSAIAKSQVMVRVIDRAGFLGNVETLSANSSPTSSSSPSDKKTAAR